MAKLPKGLSGRTVVKVFQKSGWEVKRQKGSHITLKKDGVEAILTVPLHPSVDRGTLRNLIRTADMDVDDFINDMK
jgi:predicted RNA binding protein YcfA (HicA-like mRNA interferase family)